MNWKNNAENTYPDIILHDCYINKISVSGKDVILSFSDQGFFKFDMELNNYFRTNGGEIIIKDCDLDDIWIKEIESHNSDGDFYQTMRDVNTRSLVENVNFGKWKFEIVEEFYASGSAFCTVMAGETDKKNWYYVKIYFKALHYYWNDIIYEKPF